MRRRSAGEVGEHIDETGIRWRPGRVRCIAGGRRRVIADEHGSGRVEGAHRGRQSREKRDTSSATVCPNIPAKSAVSSQCSGYSLKYSLDLGPRR